MAEDPPDPYAQARRKLARAVALAGWTLVRLEEELSRDAHRTSEPGRRADQPTLSRIVNGRRRPTVGQAVGLYCVLVGAPSPLEWRHDLPGDPPEPAAPPEPPSGMGSERMTDERPVRRGRR